MESIFKRFDDPILTVLSHQLTSNFLTEILKPCSISG